MPSLSSLGVTGPRERVYEPGVPKMVADTAKSAVNMVLKYYIKADVVVPIHFESWRHLMQKGAELRQAFEEEGLRNVIWLEPRVNTKIL